GFSHDVTETVPADVGGEEYRVVPGGPGVHAGVIGALRAARIVELAADVGAEIEGGTAGVPVVSRTDDVLVPTAGSVAEHAPGAAQKRVQRRVARGPMDARARTAFDADKRLRRRGEPAHDDEDGETADHRSSASSCGFANSSATR